MMKTTILVMGIDFVENQQINELRYIDIIIMFLAFFGKTRSDSQLVMNGPKIL